MSVLALGCGGDDDAAIDAGGGGGDGGAGADAALIDAGATVDAAPGTTPDAAPGSCGDTECSNCIDDDADGFIDGFDPECTLAADDDESSFATGISGDNMDRTWQDCFFDGDSGQGNDGCRFHTCCLLDECPEDLASGFDPLTDCEVSDQCIEFCAPAAPPGCDCFGCCTICDPDDGQCYDVFTNPAVAPDCTLDVIDNPALCPPCTPTPECGSDCEPVECVLCPGQTEDDLPPECGDVAECPGGETLCDSSADCAATEFCANGCCIPGVG